MLKAALDELHDLGRDIFDVTLLYEVDQHLFGHDFREEGTEGIDLQSPAGL